MNAKDFRIGNIVLFDDTSNDIVSISGIYSSHVHTEDENEEDEDEKLWFFEWEQISGDGLFKGGDSWIGEFLPIPLNHDFFCKNGFLYEGRHPDHAMESYHLDKGVHNTITIDTNHDNTRFWYDDREIKFVHDYQNLYWFLYNEEVKIVL